MNEINSTDILIEALEVFIHHILYVRQIYPPQIFRQRKIYNCPVFVSIYPNVNKYIAEVLTTARQLKLNKQLHKVEIVVYRGDNCIYEKYTFNVSEDSLLAFARSGEDEYLLEFEQQLRTSLYSLSEKLKSLKKLPKDANFKIQLHTTQSAFIKTCSGPSQEGFPWIQAETLNETDFKEVTLLPLSVVDSTGLKIYAEI